MSLGRAQAQKQIDNRIQKIQEIAGNYEWSIEGTSGDYKLIAYYIDGKGKKVFFVDSHGRTPQEVLNNWHVWKSLEALYKSEGTEYRGFRIYRTIYTDDRGNDYLAVEPKVLFAGSSIEETKKLIDKYIAKKEEVK